MHKKKLFRTILCLILFASCDSPDELLNSKSIQLCENGAYVWHSDPYIGYFKDTLIFSYVDIKNKEIRIGKYSNKNVASLSLSTDSSRATDSHDHAAFANINDSILILTYNRHVTDHGFFIRHYDSSLSEESFFPSPSHNVTCYSNIYYLPKNNDIFLGQRWINYKPTFSTSKDFGKSWSQPTQFLTSKGARPYVHYGQNENHIEFIATEGHPRDEKTSIFYGKLFNYTDNQHNLPIDIESLIKIYEYSEDTSINDINITIPFGRAWVWDLEFDKQGFPCCVFSVQLPQSSDWKETRFIYYYAWWSKSHGWQKKAIANGGNPLYEQESHFCGGICIDPQNTSRLIISSNSSEPSKLKIDSEIKSDNAYSLYEITLDSKHEINTFQKIISYKDELAIRPTIPKGPNSPILFMKGLEYTDFRAYSTSLYIIPDE